MGEKIPVRECECAGCVESCAKNCSEDEAQIAHVKEVDALVEYLLRLYGYCLTADTRTPLLVLQIGEGGNGKGVLNDLMSKHILGVYPDGYSCEIPMEALTVSKGGDRHPTELMDLRGSRLALARESDGDTRWNEGRVKRLSGNDRIKARRMRQDFEEFDPTHKSIIFGNAKPGLRGAGQAAWKRRLHMVPFPQKWEQKEDRQNNILKADNDLIDKLAQEAPGILQKLIDALGRYLKGGRDLAVPPTVEQASAEYLLEQNAVARWAAEKADLTNPNGTSTANECWTSWAMWAERHHEYIGKRMEFLDALVRLGVKISRTKKQRGVCLGIKLLSDPPANDVSC
jgi:putative DNA primase/helicase